MDTIVIPKRTREGSFTDQDVTDALDTLDGIEDGQAVVVARGMDSENSARNRARLLASACNAKTGTLYSAHAVPDPESDGKWIGAISVRANQEVAERPERDADAPSLRDLQAAARYLDIKGRSKMDYDALATAVTDADASSLAEWKGYAKDAAAAA